MVNCSATGDAVPLLTGYATAEFTSCDDTGKAIHGIATFLNVFAVERRTHRHPIVAMSIIWAEMISLHACALHAQWMPPANCRSANRFYLFFVSVGLF